MIVKDSKSDQSDKDCDSGGDYQDELQAIWAHNIANTKSRVLCCCPGAEPNKINIDISAHQASCWIGKKIPKIVNDTSVIPTQWHDGYGLGVAP